MIPWKILNLISNRLQKELWKKKEKKCKASLSKPNSQIKMVERLNITRRCCFNRFDSQRRKILTEQDNGEISN